MGIHVSVKMPAKPKEDANSALQSGKLGEWIESLIDIPEKERNVLNHDIFLLFVVFECGGQIFIKIPKIRIP